MFAVVRVRNEMTQRGEKGSSVARKYFSSFSELVEGREKEYFSLSKCNDESRQTFNFNFNF